MSNDGGERLAPGSTRAKARSLQTREGGGLRSGQQ